jgi:S-adenosyl-L-methionine hydrolase (adenosine-forming)
VSRGSVITLLTDFGTADSYVAEVKGVLLAGAPDATLVDITHELSPGDVTAAQVVLGRVWPRFPARSVHLAVVDPGVGTARHALALAAGGHFFVGPDNGLFTPLLDGARVVALPVPPGASPTFHGRDVFAPAAAALAAGTRLEAMGTPHATSVRRPPPAARHEGRDVVGEVLLVDRFGTLVTNVPHAAMADGASVQVASRPVGHVRRTFADVAPGQPVAYVGSGGTLEIAVRDGSAAATLDAARGVAVRVTAP